LLGQQIQVETKPIDEAHTDEINPPYKHLENRSVRFIPEWALEFSTHLSIWPTPHALTNRGIISFVAICFRRHSSGTLAF
jgi:hypothetical protein